MIPPGKSIAPRLALKLVALVSLLLAIVAAVDYGSQSRQRHRRLSERAALTADQLSASLSLPLWNFQADVVNRILDGVMESRDVAGIVIRQPNVAAPGGVNIFNRTRDGGWNAVAGNPAALRGGVIESRDILYQDKTVGSLELIATPRWVETEMRQGLALFVALSLLLDAILVVCLYGLLRREVISPLQAIGRFAGQVSAGGGETAEPLRGRFRGELDGLRASLETMVALLQSRYAAIKDSEDLFRTSFESAAVGICLVSTDGRFLNANRALCETLGYPKEELCRLKFKDITHEEDRTVGDEFMVRALAGGPATMRVEKRYIRKDGKIVWCYLSTTLIQRKQGGDGFLISYIQDITDRHRAAEALRASGQAATRSMEEAVEARLATERANLSLQKELVERLKAEAALRSSEELLRVAFRTGPFGRAITGYGDGKFRDVNERMVAWFGFTREEMIGRSPAELGMWVRPEDPQKMQALLEAEGSVENFETEMRRKNGETFWASASLSETSVGGTRLAMGLIRDITEEKRVATELRKAEGLYRGIFEGAAEGIYRTSPDGRTLAANPTIARMFGFDSPEQVLAEATDLAGMQWADPGERGRFVQRLETEGQVRNYECRMLKRDGSPFWVLTNARRVAGADGSTLYYEGFLSDITERKLLEERFLRMQRLENIGMLAAGIAHDLNNVLMPISMAVSLLRKKRFDPDETKILGMLDRSAERGAGLVRQILGFARGAAGEPQLMQAKHILLDVVAMISQTFPKSIMLDHRVPVDLWPVLANPTQLHQVLLNLCVNARDAMPKGGSLILAAENKVLGPEAADLPEGARPGPWLMLSVEDTGTGMTPEVRARIWEPFFTTKTADKGTGLGLPTVRGIVESLGGFITVDSEAGHGTRFRIFLPPAEPTAAKSAGGSEAARAVGAGETILLVDDEPLIRETARPILENAGYAVETAENGARAIEIFRSRPDAFALVVTDIDMPVMDGQAFALRAREIRPDLRILATSGLESGSAGLNRPDFADDFLLKPFVEDTFLTAVQKLVRAPART